MIRTGTILLAMLPFLAVGCSSYYIVKDPCSGNAYYTTYLNQTRGGAVVLRDEKTGATVTLQNSEVRVVSKDEYKAGLKAASPAEPAK